MSLVVMGASYKTLPIDELERVSIAQADLTEDLRCLTSLSGVSGAVIVSTCNRVEAYVESRTDRLGSDACEQFFSERCGESALYGNSAFYVKRGEDVPRHLFRVVCSLDSQVLGESQIQGQVKNAFIAASEAGTCTELLTKLFKDALHVGKRIREETALGKEPVSFSTTAFKALSREIDDLASAKVIIIGAGEMARLALSYARDNAVGSLFVANRTFAKAQALAGEYGAVAVPFDERYRRLAQVDAALSMTSANCAVVQSEALEAARIQAGTDHRRLVIIDEAVPRDVDVDCALLDGVTLYNLDSLNGIVDEGIAARLASARDVERCLEEAEDGFLSWLQEQNVAPTIREMHEKGSYIVDQELSRVVKRLSKLYGRELDADELNLLKSFGQSIMGKMLHGPTMRLRMESQTADSYYYTAAARYLFGLNTFPPGTTPHQFPENGCDGGCSHDGSCQ